MITQYSVQMMCYRTIPETCIILLTSVTPINSIKRKKKKVCCSILIPVYFSPTPFQINLGEDFHLFSLISNRHIVCFLCVRHWVRNSGYLKEKNTVSILFLMTLSFRLNHKTLLIFDRVFWVSFLIRKEKYRVLHTLLTF